jgi:hypothetical protein
VVEDVCARSRETLEGASGCRKFANGVLKLAEHQTPKHLSLRWLQQWGKQEQANRVVIFAVMDCGTVWRHYHARLFEERPIVCKDMRSISGNKAYLHHREQKSQSRAVS